MKILVCSHVRVGSKGKDGFDIHIDSDGNVNSLVYLCEQACSGAEIWKVDGHWLDGELVKVDLDGDYSIENVMIEVFDKLTPHNAALSRIIVRLLDNMDIGKIKPEVVANRINHLISISSHQPQIDTLRDIKYKFIDQTNSTQ